MQTFLLAASGSSGYGFWVFLAGVLLGLLAVAAWAAKHLRNRGYFERAADPATLFPAVPDADEVRRAA
jgi:drug/metabolite transporter (DMT)-like permease